MSRRKKRRPKIDPMIVTLSGTFARAGTGDRFVDVRPTPVAMGVDPGTGEVRLFVVDPETSKPTHRLVIRDVNEFVAAVHALESASWRH